MFISPYIQGAIEGIEVSLGFGGGAALAALPNFSKSMAQLRESQVEGECKLIDGFVHNLLNYLEEIKYEGYEIKTLEEQITEEATKVLNDKLSHINGNINATQENLAEILCNNDSNTVKDSIKKYDQQITESKETIRDIKNFTSKMKKFVDDEQRCPNKAIKNIYVSRVFPILKYKCTELEQISNRLEVELNSKNLREVNMEEPD